MREYFYKMIINSNIKIFHQQPYLLMEVNSKNFREIQSIQLKDCITTIASCKDSFAVGCIDDNFYLWNMYENKQINFDNFNKEPKISINGNSMGIININYNKKTTHATYSCMDSTIKIMDLYTGKTTSLQCNVMENWKVLYIGENIVTCGDLGKIHFYDQTSNQKLKTIQAGDAFLTSLTKSNQENLLASGNCNGDLYIINLGSNKQKKTFLKPHFKLIRDITFSDDASKLFTACDDSSIKVVDIASEKVSAIFQGHKQAVSSVCNSEIDSKILFSSSFDKSIKIWDLRVKNCVGNVVTVSPIWDIKSCERYVIGGGENGILSIYSIQ